MRIEGLSPVDGGRSFVRWWWAGGFIIKRIRNAKREDPQCEILGSPSWLPTHDGLIRSDGSKLWCNLQLAYRTSHRLGVPHRGLFRARRRNWV